MGFVYHTVAMSKEGMIERGGIMEFDYNDHVIIGFLREASKLGADAVINIEMIAVPNGWGSPIAFGISGTAIRFKE